MNQEVDIFETRKILTIKKCDELDSTIETKKYITEFEDSVVQKT